jgi:hypothetical protein
MFLDDSATTKKIIILLRNHFSRFFSASFAKKKSRPNLENIARYKRNAFLSR